MSSKKIEDKLNWWGKKGQDGATTTTTTTSTPTPIPTPAKRTQTKPKPTRATGAPKTTKTTDKKGLPLYARLMINMGVIAVAIVLGSVVAHYLLLSITRHNTQTAVPQFEMMSIYDAEQLAEESGLTLVINDSVYVQRYEGGLVLEQNPASEVMVKPGRAIYITINALNREMVAIPYVAGRSLRQAKNMLEVAGLSIGKLIYEPDLATNYVLSQSFGNQEVMKNDSLFAPRGSGIILHVGLNAADNSVEIPQLIGMSLYEARSILHLSGLNVGDVSRTSEVDSDNEKMALVVSQNVISGREASLGDYVSFVITTDRELVDRVLKEIDEAHRLEQQMLIEEQALIDSMNRAATELGVDIGGEEESKQSLPAGGSGFEDLFD